MRTYAIGDIHGHTLLLRAAHARIAADRAACGDRDAPVVHIGDLVDRGPDSRGTVEFLRAGVAEGENWVVLKGNHDRMFAGFLHDRAHHDPGLRRDLSWLHPRLGGGTTLQSYGVPNAADRPIAAVHAEAVISVPQDHLDFLDARPTIFQRGEVAFVHAGIRPDVPLDMQREDDLLWIRDAFLNYPFAHEALIVHGHTALDQPVHYGNRVNIDSGAAYGRLLTAVVIEGREVFVLGDAGREALRPTPEAQVR